jgi:hypothetical protein
MNPNKAVTTVFMNRDVMASSQSLSGVNPYALCHITRRMEIISSLNPAPGMSAT